MKQEHEMTPGVLVSGEVLSAGDARARVAVLEAELAELRKLVCVPEGYVVVPVEATRDMIDAANSARGWVETDSTNRASYRAMLAAAPEPVERVEQEAVSYYERAHGEKSPTHGMSLDERIAHVGGRTNAAGYVEFGSVMAVSALIDHVLRDSPAPQPAPTAAQDVAGPTILELMEKIDAVRMSDEEAMHHGRGAAYWNNAVCACLDAVRKSHHSGGAKA